MVSVRYSFATGMFSKKISHPVDCRKPPQTQLHRGMYLDRNLMIAAVLLMTTVEQHRLERF